jgi:hypothetical protein
MVIGQAVAAVAELGFKTLERTWGYRRFGFGPAVGGFTNTLFGGTAVNRGQAGLDVSWRGLGDGLVVELTAGPLELWLTLAGVDASLLSPNLDVSRQWVIRSQDGTEHEIDIHTLFTHVGFAAQWCRRGGRLKIGPLGVAVEPRPADPPATDVDR